MTKLQTACHSFLGWHVFLQTLIIHNALCVLLDRQTYKKNLYLSYFQHNKTLNRNNPSTMKNNA